MEVKLDHLIHARFSFFLSFLLSKWLSQWNSSGLFFPSLYPQRDTASRWPFHRVEGSNKTPWQSCLLGAAEITLCPAHFSHPSWIAVSHPVSKSWIPAWHLGLAIAFLEEENSNSGELCSKRSPWRSPRIAGHFFPVPRSLVSGGNILVPRGNTATPVNLHGCTVGLSRRARQRWR